MDYIIISYAKNNIKRMGIILISPIIWGLLLSNVSSSSIQLATNIIEFTGVNLILSIISELNKQSRECQIYEIVRLYRSKQKMALYNLKCGFITLGPFLLILVLPLSLFSAVYFIAALISLLTVLYISIVANYITNNELMRRIIITFSSVLILVSALIDVKRNIFLSIEILFVSIIILVGWLYVADTRFEK